MKKGKVFQKDENYFRRKKNVLELGIASSLKEFFYRLPQKMNIKQNKIFI